MQRETGIDPEETVADPEEEETVADQSKDEKSEEEDYDLMETVGEIFNSMKCAEPDQKETAEDEPDQKEPAEDEPGRKPDNLCFSDFRSAE